MSPIADYTRPAPLAPDELPSGLTRGRKNRGLPDNDEYPVVCQKSADPKRQQFPNTGGWHDRRSRSCVRRPGGNPCSLAEISLFPNVGNSPARTSSGAGSETLPRRKSGSGQLPCIFPVDQGFRSRDEFAIDCAHRHLVWAAETSRPPWQPEKFPRFRGVLRDRLLRQRTGDS